MKTPVHSAASNQFLTRRQAAAIAQVSVPTLKRYEASGRLQGHRVGPKLVRYAEQDVRALFTEKAPATPVTRG